MRIKHSGEDLLNTFSVINVELRHLNHNVVKGWFDTDCEKTRELLNWLCSLSKENFVSPLERQEFENIEEQLTSAQCAEELAILNPDYISVFNDNTYSDEMLPIKDEIELLEQENKDLDKLIKIYESVDVNISSDLTHITLRDIQSNAETKKSQEECMNLCENIEELHRKLQQTLTKYDPDAHIVNFVNVEEYRKNIENLESLLAACMRLDKTFLDNSDDHFPSELETCRKRILHSHRIYLANKVETEKLTEILNFLNTTNVNDIMLGWNPQSKAVNLEAKELYKKKMCEELDNIASKYADYCLKQVRLHYVEQELEDFKQKSENISKVLDSVTRCLSYYALTNCLQFQEKKDVECISNFYRKMLKYIDEDLHRCRARTDRMKTVIEEYKSYLARPAYERSKLTSSIAKILSSDGYSLKSVAEAVGRFKFELNMLESNVFWMDFKNEKVKMQEVNDNVMILQKFLMSGPTNRVVLIPLELQKVWFEIEEYLKKESVSVGEAVQIPQTVRKAMTKSQSLVKELWINFWANPSKIEMILKRAEEDFSKRTEQYF